jgi:hypothetical protein
MSTTITYLRIKRAIEKNSECFLCNLETEFEQRYLDNYLQELVMDSKARDKIVESRGFCNNHSYKLLIEASKPTSSDGHGVALITQSVIEQLIQDIPEQKNPRKDYFSKVLVNAKKCPACIHLADYMKTYIEITAGLLASSEEFSKLFKESGGLCIPHFTTLTCVAEGMETNQSRNILDLLNEIERKNLQRLNEELAEYIKRQSYEFSEKDRSAIANVVVRSVEKIAGKRGMKSTFKNIEYSKQSG